MSLSGPMLFDPRAFWGDEEVMMMTVPQVFAYLRLLSRQWENGSIPADPERIAALLSEGPRRFTAADVVGEGGTMESPAEGSLWGGLRGCYASVEGGLRLHNARLNEEREEWIAKREKASEAGKKGARIKAAKANRKKKLQPTSSHPKATLKGRSGDPSTDPLPLPSPVPSPEEEKDSARARGEARESKPKKKATPGLPAPLSPWYTGIPEAKRIAELIADPAQIDPKTHQSENDMDEEAMREERAHRLARLFTLPSNGSGATLCQLWVGWRKGRKTKHKTAVRPPADDWISEVRVLRDFEGRPSREVRDALDVLVETCWQGCDWHLIEQKLAQKQSGGGGKAPQRDAARGILDENRVLDIP